MIGKKISHYGILEKIGEGGMSVVYKAEDTTRKRLVALKLPYITTGGSTLCEQGSEPRRLLVHINSNMQIWRHRAACSTCRVP